MCEEVDSFAERMIFNFIGDSHSKICRPNKDQLLLLFYLDKLDYNSSIAVQLSKISISCMDEVFDKSIIILSFSYQTTFR
jgi:hypothetical protein